MHTLIAPLGSLPPTVTETAASAIETAYGVDTTVLRPGPVPAFAHDTHRDQYAADEIVQAIPTPRDGDADATESAAATGGEPVDRFVALIDVDLFHPGHTFVFGLARPNGHGCVISTARLLARRPPLPGWTAASGRWSYTKSAIRWASPTATRTPVSCNSRHW